MEVMRRWLVLPLALLATLCTAQTTLAKLEEWDFTKRPVKAADLKGLNLYELANLRALVFGRHGRTFQDWESQSYLHGFTWYKPDPKFTNARLNAVERASIDVIRGAEASHHETIQPGDLRFWMTRTITTKNLGEPPLVDLHVMHAEIEAIHGKRFDGEPAIQRYFEARYWYKPASGYDAKVLSKLERTNLDFLASLIKKRRALRISPGMGDMLAFQKAALPPNILKGLSLWELRLLRNEVYALRGHRFTTPWILDWFSNEEWYAPLPKGQKAALSAMDHRNVASILKVEQARHDALSTTALKPDDLAGLFLDDATRLRQEIEARHGKVFAGKWLQGYFESLPWYKRNPAYSPKLLNAIEKKNMATIAEHEETAMNSWPEG